MTMRSQMRREIKHLEIQVESKVRLTLPKELSLVRG